MLRRLFAFILLVPAVRGLGAQDVAAQDAWKLRSPMWRMISARFYNLYHIDLRKHVKTIIEVKPTINAGFDFVPVDGNAWGDALKRAGFQPDMRERILGIIPSVGSVAAMATHGQGYRENNEPSLHCAVAKDRCNIHLDNIAIRVGSYNANAPQHVVDELIRGAEVFAVARERGLLRRRRAGEHGSHFGAGFEQPAGLAIDDLEVSLLGSVGIVRVHAAYLARRPVSEQGWG